MALIQKSFSDLITFTRASGGGRFNAQGQYEWLPANQPRIDFDPVTGEAKGLLIEEQRTNLLTYSSDFANAVWTKTDVTVTSGFISPSGLADAYGFIEPSTGSVSPRATRGTSLTAGRHMFAFYAKAGLRSWVRATTSNGSVGNDIWFDVATGVVGNVGTLGGGLGAVGSIAPAGNGFFRCQVSFTATAGNNFTNIAAANANGEVFYAVTGGAAIYAWGAQLEAGAFPTSYIPTTTAQVTRAADIASVNELSPWYRADEGSFIAEFKTPVNSAIKLAYRIGNGTGSVGPYAINSDARVDKAGTGRIITHTAVAGDGLVKHGLSYDVAGIYASANGFAVLSSTQKVQNAPAQLHIGSDSAGNFKLNGHIRALRFYPKRLSDTELQSLTAN